MSNFIKNNMLTVGYNPQSGQHFFDLLKHYEKYIHSYFFSFTHGLVGNKYIPNQVINDLIRYDKYGFKGNILFNTYESEKKWKRQMEIATDAELINSCTILSLDVAEKIKHKYPDIDIHLSVRFWDWNDNVNPHELLEKNYDKIKDLISCINISGYRSYNDHDLIKKIKDMRIKTKFIANEGCITRKYENYKNFEELNGIECMSQFSNCKRICDHEIFVLIPWLQMCRVNFYKEQLQYYDYDIIKISTRDKPLNELTQILEYWTNDNIPKYLPYSVYGKINIQNHYEEYLEWIKQRSFCSNDCYHCQRCKKYYDLMIE